MGDNETRFWFDLDLLRARIDNAIQILLALSAAAECGFGGSEDYVKSVLGVHDYMNGLNRDLERIIENMRAAASGGHSCAS